MLAEGNGEALDCALAAQELLERALGAEEAGALLREVGNFDFDAALVRVRNIGARLAPALSAHALPLDGGGLGGGDEATGLP